MNRRAFIKGLFATGALFAVDVNAAIEQTLTDCIKMSDDEFITYITFTANLYVHNPAMSAMITNIEEV